MIALLRGKVVSQVDNEIILEVNGIGYQLFLTGAAMAKISGSEEMVSFYTHLQVKEDGLTLYGFATADEKKTFQKIISVSGTGPRTALNILLTLSANQFIAAVSHGDRKTLTTVSGVGKKTAERLILELKDSLGTVITSEDWDLNGDLAIPSVGITQDAISALIALGYSANEAESLVSEANLRLNDANDLQELIKMALSLVGRGTNN